MRRANWATRVRGKAGAHAGCYTSRMPVELIKIVDGRPAHVSANLLNCKMIKCGLCEHTYEFRYSDGEVTRLSEWLPKAQRAVNDCHTDAHSVASLQVSW
jgi:hypothetical protein